MAVDEKYYRQIEMIEPPVKPKHVITKEYFEANSGGGGSCECEFATIKSFKYFANSNVINSTSDTTRQEAKRIFEIPEIDIIKDLIIVYVDGFAYMKGNHFIILDATHIEFNSNIAPESEVWGEIYQKLVVPQSSGVGGYFIFNQTTEATEWVIQHNLGYIPIVQAIDIQGYEIICSVRHIDENNCLLQMNSAISGKAICR